MKLAILIAPGLLGPVEGWIDETKHNGWEMPMMTEAQLEALIKAQDPTLKPNVVDKVFFDKQHGFSIQSADGDCEKLDKYRNIKVPNGDTLYDAGFNWCWQKAD